MIASLDKTIRRLTGFKVGDADLTVSLVPGTGIVLKPLGSPKAEEVSVNALELYQLLQDRKRPPDAVETPPEAMDELPMVRRLLELSAIVRSPEEDSATERERYLTTVRVRSLVQRLLADMEG